MIASAPGSTEFLWHRKDVGQVAPLLHMRDQNIEILSGLSLVRGCAGMKSEVF